MKHQIALTLLLSTLLAAPAVGSVGEAIYSPEINWSGTLYFFVLGGPANTCGDLYVSRNGGSYIAGPGWLCTDSAGNAVKGPWHHSSQSTDETADAYIGWPGGTTTNTARHIWDVEEPTVLITSPLDYPIPTSFYGKAVDPPYGAGFSSAWGSVCTVTYSEVDTGRHWSSGTAYGAGSAVHHSCSLAPLPAHTTYWTPSAVPPASAHVSGYCYTWKAWCYENPSERGPATASRSFCVP